MLPGEVSYTIEQEVYLKGDPTAVPPRPDETYGPEFAGTFTVKYPTVAQTIAISSRTTAALQAFGVQDTLDVRGPIYDLVAAITWLGELASVKPPWLSVDSDAEPKRLAAINRAWRLGQEKLAEGKKKSSGAPLLTGT